MGDRRGIATALGNLGNVACGEGDYAMARQLYEESLALRRELGNMGRVGGMLCQLAKLAQLEGDLERAEALCRESLTLCRDAGVKRLIVSGLSCLASIACATQQPGRAARLLGATQALREAIRAVVWPTEQAEDDRCVAAIRSQLDEAAFIAAWAEGQAMSLDQAVAYALGLAPIPEQSRA